MKNQGLSAFISVHLRLILLFLLSCPCPSFTISNIAIHSNIPSPLVGEG
jgi:hypothetical protein